jgi:hypothetical protein
MACGSVSHIGPAYAVIFISLLLISSIIIYIIIVFINIIVVSVKLVLHIIILSSYCYLLNPHKSIRFLMLSFHSALIVSLLQIGAAFAYCCHIIVLITS